MLLVCEIIMKTKIAETDAATLRGTRGSSPTWYRKEERWWKYACVPIVVRRMDSL